MSVYKIEIYDREEFLNKHHGLYKIIDIPANFEFRQFLSFTGSDFNLVYADENNEDLSLSFEGKILPNDSYIVENSEVTED